MERPVLVRFSWRKRIEIAAMAFIVVVGTYLMTHPGANIAWVVFMHLVSILLVGAAAGKFVYRLAEQPDGLHERTLLRQRFLGFHEILAVEYLAESTERGRTVRRPVTLFDEAHHVRIIAKGARVDLDCDMEGISELLASLQRRGIIALSAAVESPGA